MELISFYHGIDLLKLESIKSFVFANFGLAPISILLENFCMPAAFSWKSIRGNSLNRSYFFSNPSKRLLTKEVMLPLLIHLPQFGLACLANLHSFSRRCCCSAGKKLHSYSVFTKVSYKLS